MKREEAIERIKTRFDKWALDDEDMKAIQTLIPELRESEDERIRKEMIHFLKSEKAFQTIDLPVSERWIAYLEKQKEQKNPLEDYSRGYNDGYYHGVTDQMQKEQKPAEWSKDTMDEFTRNIRNLITDKLTVHTKGLDGSEISSTVFIDDKTAKDIASGILFYVGKEAMKNPNRKIPEWSEDNIEELTDFEAAMLHIGMSFFGDFAGLNPNNTNEVKKQAKLLLELVPKKEWSEEDEKMLDNICSKLYALPEERDKMQKWLKSLSLNLKKKNEDVAKLCSNEWSEEDERMHQALIHDLRVICEKDYPDNINLKKELDWFKSLRPCPHWKPSEEQIEALERLLKYPFDSDELSLANRKHLAEIVSQLKKL